MPSKRLKYDKVERLNSILARLAEHYPEARTGLDFQNPYQLFVATVLSAQTTDDQVNRITPAFFKYASSFGELARLEPHELEPYLKKCGLFRHKSRYLVQAARVIVEQYGGEVPESFDELIKLPGVGRKTASVIVSCAFDKPALAVDTHVFRVSRRLGLADGKNVEKVEEQLKSLITDDQWIEAHHRLIAHGRTLCKARKPLCSDCFLKDLCSYIQERGENIELE